MASQFSTKKPTLKPRHDVSVSRATVVCNTTPIINLVGVGQLDLLRRLYGTVAITDVVRDEYVAGKAATDPDLDPLPWLQIVTAVPLDPSLPALLGAGEAATLSLALTINASAVLLDEAYGRRIARKRGLPISGTLGIVLAAKQAGLLAAVKPVIDAMIGQGSPYQCEAPGAGASSCG